MHFVKSLLLLTLLSPVYSLVAQSVPPVVSIERRVVSTSSYRTVIPDDAVIYDSTGRRMKLAEFAELNRAEPGGHRLIPEYNEYGKPAFYTYRRTTKEERETRRFMDRNPELAPKAGQKMPLFVMKAVDGKTYSLADLAGKNVVLSFWTTLQRVGINNRQIERLTQQLTPYIQSGKVISLGVAHDEAGQLASLIQGQALPFIPVGDGRGFAVKYNIVQFPTVIVIDKTGTVVANLQTIDFDGLGDLLKGLK